MQNYILALINQLINKKEIPYFNRCVQKEMQRKNFQLNMDVY